LLAKAAFSSSQRVWERQRIAALDAEVDALRRQAMALGAEPTADIPLATAAQPTAFLLAKDIQGARTQPPRIAFACPRKLDYQLRDWPHKRCVTVASQQLRALPNDLDVKEIVNL
jgi:hypothetical protein